MERRPSLPRVQRRDPGHSLEPRPHTRVDEESAIGRKYSFGDVLGQGTFGVVREVTNRLTGLQYAMKVVNKDKPGSSTIHLLEREVEVLKMVNHTHIIQLEEVFETPKKMYLVMELCKGGELWELLKRKRYFMEEEAKVVMRSLAEVVVYMHDNDIVHRDLKLENILLSTADPRIKLNIKVTDFGLVHMKSLPGCDDMYLRCGTPYYMAPEVLKNRHEYTKMCDVWSMGVIMYQLLCGQLPFHSDNAVKLEELISRGELTFSEIEWINVSSRAKDLLKSMLCVDTTQRFTARRVLDHVWFTGEAERGVLNALALMRDMQTSGEEGEQEQTPSPHSPSKSLTVISEKSEGENAAQVRDQAQSQPETPRRKSLGQKRQTRSFSTVSPPPGSGLKFPSTSSLSSVKSSSSPAGGSSSLAGTSQGRRRSTSAISKSSTPTRPITTHGRSRSEKKHSLPSRTGL